MQTVLISGHTNIPCAFKFSFFTFPYLTVLLYSSMLDLIFLQPAGIGMF